MAAPSWKKKRLIELVAASRVVQTNFGNLDVRQGAATEGRPYSTFHDSEYFSEGQMLQSRRFDNQSVRIVAAVRTSQNVQ